MSDPQLERSMLEAKERDELFAIATALGSKPAARTKKADLVSQILQVAGVEQAEAPGDDKPRRTRAAKREQGSGSTAAEADAAEQLELATSNGNGSAPRPATAVALGAVSPGAAEDGSAGATTLAPPEDGFSPAAAEAEPAQAYQRGEARYRAERLPDRGDSDVGLGNSRRRRRRNRDKGGRGPERERELAAPVLEVPYTGELVACSGLLDLREEGYGFLRTNGYLASGSDVYVSITQVRRYGLRKGDYIEGAYRPAANNEKYPALQRVDTVWGLPAEEARNRPKFENLTPLFPDERLRLEVPGDPANVTARIVDLISPIGKGQRGMIVSPPKAGKTTVLKQIAHSIETNNPEVHLMILLIEERPEEVTDWRRSVKGEVIASTFDRPSDEHTQVAELAIEKARRMLEMGRDVVIVLDGITRLARAYNLAQPATGRIMSGGIDTGALYPPRKFFGAARNVEEGGSLTILATALVETGSRMDEVIFEEFKGTGNMELRLDRKLAERRIYPAIDVNASSTRHEELLFDRNQLQQVWKLRRVLNALATDGNAAAGLELLVDKIRSTRSNDQFLAEIAKTPAPAI
jgi:transcription termination factor Rho